MIIVKDNYFHLLTDKTSYVFMINEAGLPEHIYYGKKTYATYDRSALQWNRFVKDFCSDEATAIYKERLKAAAALWKIVRESDLPKEYSRGLLEKYKNMIGGTSKD